MVEAGERIVLLSVEARLLKRRESRLGLDR